MDRTNEGAPNPPAALPPPVAVQPLRVTPDNVVELAVLFRNAADDLLNQLTIADNALLLSEPWMHDEASEWMWKFFNTYFHDGATSFKGVLQSIYDQHDAHATALENAATLYGKAEELHAAHHARLLGQLPG